MEPTRSYIWYIC